MLLAQPRTRRRRLRAAGAAEYRPSNASRNARCRAVAAVPGAAKCVAAVETCRSNWAGCCYLFDMLLELFKSKQSPPAPRATVRTWSAVAPLSDAGTAVDFSHIVRAAVPPWQATHAPLQEPVRETVKVTAREQAPVAAHASAPASTERAAQVPAQGTPTPTAAVVAVPDPQAPAKAASFLAELEHEVRSLPVLAAPDRDTVERNTRLANTACRTALDYWTRLVEHLNALKLRSRSRYVFDGRTAVESLTSHNFRVLPKLRTGHGGEEHYESVALSWRVGGGERMKMLKDFPAEADRLRARLAFAGINAFESQSRDPESGRLRGTQFEFTADVSASVRITPLHDAGKIRLTLQNLDALERIEADFPAFAMRPGELDEIARLVCGRANSVLKHAQNVVRHEP